MIAILGGTFDPIHFGHLRTALDVIEALGCSELRFLPLGVAVHRQQPQASAPQRLSMLDLAIAEESRFRIDHSELQRRGPSFMVDTLTQLRTSLRGPLCLLLGADAFSQFLSWREPQTILSLCHLVIMVRPGHPLPMHEGITSILEQHRAEAANQLMQQDSGRILIQPVTQLEISSSDIRQRLQQGRSVRYLLPEPVLQYIQQQQLYREAGPLQAKPIAPPNHRKHDGDRRTEGAGVENLGGHEGIGY